MDDRRETARSTSCDAGLVARRQGSDNRGHGNKTGDFLIVLREGSDTGPFAGSCLLLRQYRTKGRLALTFVAQLLAVCR